MRQGLRSLLDEFDDLEVVGEAGSAEEVLAQVARLRPDVLLLDVRMKGTSSINVAREVRRAYPDTHIVILTTYADEEYFYGAMRAGVDGYLLKDVALDMLPDSLRAVCRGERVLSPSLVGKVMEGYRLLAEENVRLASGLTEEEVAILRQIAQGATTREIAQTFYWSEVTAKKKVQEILVKLGATNRAQAVAIAIRKGII